jgi:hypothetical protein
MCESLRPGTTVRPLPSMTVVVGPRGRSISSLLPVALTLPFSMAIAWTNDGVTFVAIFAL